MTPAEKLAAKLPKRKMSAPRNDGLLKCSIRSRRTALGLSLRVVGKAVGISDANLHRIEHGGDVGISRAFRLAKFFGTSIEELWRPTP